MLPLKHIAALGPSSIVVGLVKADVPASWFATPVVRAVVTIQWDGFAKVREVDMPYAMRAAGSSRTHCAAERLPRALPRVCPLLAAHVLHTRTHTCHMVCMRRTCSTQVLMIMHLLEHVMLMCLFGVFMLLIHQ